MSGVTGGIPARRLLQTQVISSAVSVVDFTGLPYAGFEAFELEYSGLLTASNAVTLYARLHQAGGGWITSGYHSAHTFQHSTGSSAGYGLANGGQFMIGNRVEAGGGANMGGWLRVHAPASGWRKVASFGNAGWDSSTAYAAMRKGWGIVTSTAQIDGVRLFASSGNLTAGNLKLYGVR